MTYKKHRIYITKAYPTGGNTVELPNSAKWGVSHYQRSEEVHGIFSPSLKGPIMMYLNDDERCFWPVMSFLTDEEATVLAGELLAAVKLNSKED